MVINYYVRYVMHTITLLFHHFYFLFLHVLQYLIMHANKPRTHRDLAHAVWQRDGSGEVEYVRIVINQLRRKLEPDPAKPRYLLTERSVGYRLHMPVEA